MRSLLILLALTLGCGDDLIRIDARDDVGLIDGAMGDAGVDASVDARLDGALELYPARYDEGRRHSPLTPFVVENLRAVRARADDLEDDVFAKVGASTTVSTNFMHCFDGDAVTLDGRDALQPMIDVFAAGDAGGANPFVRDSVSAVVGWHAGRALEGDPPPIEQEVEAIRPAYAVVMYGTDDTNIVDIEAYAENMLDLTDGLLDRGVVPVLSTFMARGDDPTADAKVPRFNMAVRAIAQARQVPFVDYHMELESLPNRGLGGDDIHPSVYSPSGSRACDFSAAGLDFGYNVRNLVTIESFDRTWRVTTAGEDAPDPAGPRLMGDGSPTAPFVIDTLPFTHVANTVFSEHRNLDFYTGCAAAQDESGPEYLYRLELDRPHSLWIRVFDRGAVDVDVHLLDAPGEAGCLERAHQDIEVDLSAGTYHLALDTFVGSAEQVGEYLLVVMER